MTSKKERLPAEHLLEILTSPQGSAVKEAFVSFVNSHLCAENYDFWHDVEDFRRTYEQREEGGEMMKEHAKRIWEKYLSEDAPDQINITAEVDKQIQDAVLYDKITSRLFDKAQKEVFALMKNDSYPKFLRTPEFKKLEIIERKRRLENEEDWLQNPTLSFALRWTTLSIVVGTWFFWTTLDAKIRAVMVAIAFAGIETVFRALTDRKPGVRFTQRLSLSFIMREGKTTWEQFFMNVFIFGPISTDIYRSWLDNPSAPTYSAVLRVLCFPLNIWVSEFVVGTYLARIWGRRGWYYEGPLAFLDGTITLAYGHYWLVLALANEWACVNILYPFSFALAHALGG